MLLHFYCMGRGERVCNCLERTRGREQRKHGLGTVAVFIKGRASPPSSSFFFPFLSFLHEVGFFSISPVAVSINLNPFSSDRYRMSTPGNDLEHSE